MKAIILAGGFGSRLKQKVPDLPKPMAPVAGRPFLEYVLDRLVTKNITEIILSVGYKAELIIDHFGNSYRNKPIRYVIESKPLGTGGAIVKALHSETESTLVLNGDTLLNISFDKLIDDYKQNPARIMLVLKEINDVSRYGSVKINNDRITGFLEKGKNLPGYINAGVYIVKPEIFKDFKLSGTFSFETNCLQNYCNELAPTAFFTDAYFIDIGIPEDYERAQTELPLL